MNNGFDKNRPTGQGARPLPAAKGASDRVTGIVISVIGLLLLFLGIAIVANAITQWWALT